MVPPYFERLALYELQGHLANYGFTLGEYEIHQGGIELKLPLELGTALNASLKIPTRILLRLATKEILSFKELEQFFKEFQWKDFGPLREVYASSRSSKMKMKDAIEQSFKKTIPYKPQKTGTDVYIRMFRDQCTLSVDTSGDDLFQRGYEKWVGEAPIRDNMASGLLQLALQGTDAGEDWEIVDPMMGAGTLLTEAYTLRSPSPRKFCYQNWTGKYKVNQLEINKQASNIAIVGRDRDQKHVDIAKKNLAQVGATNADLALEDLFSSSQAKPATRKRLVILNPPYGKRIAIKGKNFFQETVNQISKKYSPDRLGIIVPRDTKFEAEGLERIRHMLFSNQGIDVEFYLLLKK